MTRLPNHAREAEGDDASSFSSFPNEGLAGNGFQSTLSRSVALAGTGLHSGKAVELNLRPAQPDTGIVFEAAGGEPGGPVSFRAELGSLVSGNRATTLGGTGSARVSTVEHLLAALLALRVDNVWIDVKGGELPVFDGSARVFFDAVREAGRESLATPRTVLRVTEVFCYREGERCVEVVPAPDFALECMIDFDHPAIGRQRIDLSRVDAEVFDTELAGARTFGFEDEVEALHAAGQALGGSLANSIVVGAGGVLNESGLRWPDEFVRHKAVDLLGDLALLGAPLRGRVRVERGGHALHHRFIEALLASDAWVRESSLAG